MPNLKRLPAVVGATLVVVLLAYAAFYFFLLDLFVDFWWFQSLQLEFYFWLKLLYRLLLSGAVTLALFSIFFLHFWIASNYLGLSPREDIDASFAKRRRFQRWAELFVSGSAKVYTPLSLVLAIIVAVPFYDQWESGLLFFFGQTSGVRDTLYGHDISFYLLNYPMYLLIQVDLLAVAVLVFCSVATLYWLERAIVPGQRRQFPLGAKIHLTVLAGFVVGFVVWGFMLERFALLYNNTHEPVFFGPGFVEIRYQLPLIWLKVITFLATAASAVLLVFSKRHLKTPLIVSSLGFLVALGLPELKFIPELLETYVVSPNPVRTQGTFIKHNIDATLAAYGLDQVKTVKVPVSPIAEDLKAWTPERFEDVPVWDREFIIDTFQQLQEIRPYYRIKAVDEDRYSILGRTRQVNIAAREVDVSKLPVEAQNWENMHMRYTHGFGAVMTPASQDADQPLAWYLRDLDLLSPVGLSVRHPDIFYGQVPEPGKSDYVIIPNTLEVVGVPRSDIKDEHGYDGFGGIPVSSLFRKALLAIYFEEQKIFFSANMTWGSRVKMRRNIAERIHHIVPFLHLDKDPYLVMTKDRFYWLVDAYTLSNYYPVSTPSRDEFLHDTQEFNYIRNSVKITVDAVNGKVDLYIADPTDVIVTTFSNAYPGVFKDLKEMPEELRQHLRYPRDLYYQQMRMYAKYHQVRPELFYEQAETWAPAIVRDQPVLPYYQTMRFGNCGDRKEFVMLNPMTPINRSNLSMIGVASILDTVECGDDYKPAITVYKFDKKVQVNGPAQIEALTQQVPEISAQFTLWGQGGSTISLGRMVILPMGNTVVYVQPVYILSSKNQIPELVRVIVTVGNETVMDRTIAAAFERLRQKLVRDPGTAAGPAGRNQPPPSPVPVPLH